MKIFVFALLATCLTCQAQQASQQRRLSPQELSQIVQVRSRIVRHLKVDPDVPDSAQADVEIEYDESGSIVTLAIVRSNGNDAFDAAIKRAVFLAAPFHIPAHLGPDGKPVRRVVFHFMKNG